MSQHGRTPSAFSSLYQSAQTQHFDNRGYFSHHQLGQHHRVELCLRWLVVMRAATCRSLLAIMKGQHDDRLQWPFTGTIIIELLNWLEDKGHYKMTISIDTNDDFVRY